jgi:hypothetical protein
MVMYILFNPQFRKTQYGKTKSELDGNVLDFLFYGLQNIKKSNILVLN